MMLAPIRYLLYQLVQLMPRDHDSVISVPLAAIIMLIAAIGTDDESVINRVSSFVTKNRGTIEQQLDAMKQALAFFNDFFDAPICVIAPDVKKKFLDELLGMCKTAKHFTEFNLKEINTFICKATNGAFENFLKEGPSFPLNLMVFACSSFEGNWFRQPIDQKTPFELRNGSHVTYYPTTLKAKPEFFCQKRNQFEGFGMALDVGLGDSSSVRGDSSSVRGGRYYGMFVMPDQDLDWEKVDPGQCINDILECANVNGYDALFPEFRVETNMDFKKVVTGGTDTDVPMVNVGASAVLSKLKLAATITCNSKGTSAASTGLVEVVTRGMRATIRLKRPFWYFIVWVSDDRQNVVPLYFTCINGNQQGVPSSDSFRAGPRALPPQADQHDTGSLPRKRNAEVFDRKALHEYMKGIKGLGLYGFDYIKYCEANSGKEDSDPVRGSDSDPVRGSDSDPVARGSDSDPVARGSNPDAVRGSNRGPTRGLGAGPGSTGPCTTSRFEAPESFNWFG